MKKVKHLAVITTVVLSSCALVIAQGPAGAKGGAPGKAAPRPALSVSSSAWPDGGEVPMRHAGRGENKSPMFEFHWTLAGNPTEAPDTLKTYAVIFHDIE